MFMDVDHSLQCMESGQQFVIMVIVVQKLRLGCGSLFKYFGLWIIPCPCIYMYTYVHYEE